MATLGRRLVHRGHRVTAFQIPGIRQTIEAHGIEFWPLGNDDQKAAEMKAALAKLVTLTGISAIRFSVECGRRLATTICEHAPAALRQSGVELLIVDENEPAGATVAQRCGIPFVNLCSLPLNREPAMPPPFVPWTYNLGRFTLLKNRIAYRVFDFLVSPVNKVLNGYRKRWNLPPVRQPDDTFSNLAQLCQLTADFDFPREERPVCLHYLGPFYDDARPPVAFPHARLNGKPLVYCSFGTVQDRADCFEAVATACAALPVQLVIAKGQSKCDASRQLRGDPIVVEYAPQIDLLTRAAVCITHAGLNTTMECLSQGVPMIAVPNTNDQPAVAARIAWTGSGLVVPMNQLTAERLRGALGRVLEDRTFRAAAGRLRSSVEAAGGVNKAAEIVEQFIP